MILLHAELNDPETAIGREYERSTDRGKDVRRAEAAKCAAQGDVHGMRGAMSCSGEVRDTRTAPRL